MSYHPSDENSLGLYCDGAFLKAAKIAKVKGRIEIQELIETALPRKTEDVNPLYIDLDKQKIQKYSHELLSASSLSGTETLVRRLKMKLVKQKEIDEAFIFQAEPLLPYPVETAILDKWVLEKQPDASTIAFVSTQKESLKAHLEMLNEWGIDPETISTDAVGYTALLQYYAEKTPLQLLIGIERKETTCALIKEGKLIASHVIAEGWETLYEACQKDHATNPISPKDFFSKSFAERFVEGSMHLMDQEKQFFQSMEWNQIALMKETKLSETPTLIVTGEGANIPELPESIAHTLHLTLGNLASPTNKQAFHAFALPIGLALSQQPSFREKVNFRQQELSYSAPWKRLKKPLAILSLLSIALAASFYLFSLSYLSYREDLLREKFLEVLTLSRKSYEEFEKSYETKNRIETPDGALLQVQALSAEDLDLRIDQLEKEIRTLPDTFPLFPNTPRVSDFLAWVNAHPSFQCLEGKECPNVLIDNLTYTMVKRPDLNKKKEKYQVKVGLEFSTDSPKAAREFHDALITPNDFVDPKEEIKWNATKGKYRTSFFLKDKTFYPAPLKSGGA